MSLQKADILLLTLFVKCISIFLMQPNAYKTTYLRNWTFTYGSPLACLLGATPAFAMVRVNDEDIDMSIVRQFGMNT